MPFRCLIIDDDLFIHTLLVDKLEYHFPEIQVGGTALTGEDGIRLIEEIQPDLIFLDVEMTDMTGFEMLRRVPEIHFQIIFITSYSHYAIKAIRFNALDYILKPIDLGELKAAISRLKKKSQHPQRSGHYQQVHQNLKATSSEEETLILHPHHKELRLSLSSIIQIQGERNYSYIHLGNQRKKLVSKTLGDLEDILAGKGFFRCHKSHLVNGKHILSHPHKTAILLSNHQEIPISRRKKDAYQAWYNGGCP